MNKKPTAKHIFRSLFDTLGFFFAVTRDRDGWRRRTLHFSTYKFTIMFFNLKLRLGYVFCGNEREILAFVFSHNYLCDYL